MKGVALVTGAASGIGQATAGAFIRAGVTRITIADVQADKLEQLKAEYAASSGVEVNAVTCNVSDSPAVKAMVGSTVDKFGRLDYAVNCAGIMGELTRFADLTNEAYDKTIATNQNGVFYCLREQLAVMKDQDLLEGHEDEGRRQRGAIVSIASVAGLFGVDALAAYVASKHAVVGLAKVGCIDYGGMGIRVNSIAPGYIMTPMTQQAFQRARETSTRAPDFGDVKMKPVPMPRPGRPEEIADVAVFLCSEKASFVNGATWPVDGGHHVV